MRYLLDTHTIFWAVEDPGKLSQRALSVIQDNQCQRFLSAATIWEISIKIGTGKLRLSLPFRFWMKKVIEDLNLEVLPITVEFAEKQALLPPVHKDPFDRLLIAQSLVDEIPIISIDQVLDSYGINRIW